MSSARGGFSALEVLVSSALLAAAIVPIVAAVHSSSRLARLDEQQVLASRRVRRALELLRGQPYHLVVAAARGEAPPAERHPRLSPGSRELPPLLPPVEEDLASLTGPNPGELDRHRRHAEGMPVRVFLEELEPGLARVAAWVSWRDPVHGTRRDRVAVAFLESPFHWRRGR